ncbi:MAG: exonuclease SbcCD subunit D [Bacteroidia bacterium]|nr:exonuclease SbcCD subunit D [Bacteroidia bacterium]
MPFRFLHCADVHLGKYGHQSPERYGDYFSALAAVVRHACEERVDAVLVAGDLFDEQEPSNETLRRAMETLRPLRTAGIPAAAIEGNHDRRKRGEPSGPLDLLHSEGYLRLLRPDYDDAGIVLGEAEGGALWKPAAGITVAGIGFVAHRIEEHLARAAAQLPDDDIVILLAHFMVAKTSDALEYGCIAQEDLSPLEQIVTCLALGHRHTRVGLDGETDGWIFNPGSLEYVNPLDYRLPAELRGFYDITVSDELREPEPGCLHAVRRNRHLYVRHVPTDKRPAHTLRVDVSGASSPSDIVERLREAAASSLDEQARARRPIVVVRLVGALGLSRVLLPRDAMSELLKEDFGALHVEILMQDVLSAGDHGTLILDDAGLERVMDRARVIAAGLLRDRGIAHGREEELAAELLNVKAQLQGLAQNPGPAVLDDVRRRLLPFVEYPELSGREAEALPGNAHGGEA